MELRGKNGLLMETANKSYLFSEWATNAPSPFALIFCIGLKTSENNSDKKILLPMKNYFSRLFPFCPRKEIFLSNAPPPLLAQPLK